MVGTCTKHRPAKNNKEIVKIAKISNSHEAIKFAGGVAGKNYVKTIAVEGIGAIEEYH